MSEVDANSGGCLAISTEPLCSKTRCQPHAFYYVRFGMTWHVSQAR